MKNNIMYCHKCNMNTETKFEVEYKFMIGKPPRGIRTMIIRQCTKCGEKLELEVERRK